MSEIIKPKSGIAKMAEVSSNTGQVAGGSGVLQEGVYRHLESGETIIALHDPVTGDAQARGYVRAGFVWERAIDYSEVKVIGAPLSSDASVDSATSETLELKAKLAEAEAAKVAAEKKAEDAKAEAEAAKVAAEKKAEDAKAEAEAALKMAQESEKSNKKESK